MVSCRSSLKPTHWIKILLRLWGHPQPWLRGNRWETDCRSFMCFGHNFLNGLVGRFTGKPRLESEIDGFPVGFPCNRSIDFHECPWPHDPTRVIYQVVKDPASFGISWLTGNPVMSKDGGWSDENARRVNQSSLRIGWLETTILHLKLPTWLPGFLNIFRRFSSARCKWNLAR